MNQEPPWKVINEPLSVASSCRSERRAVTATSKYAIILSQVTYSTFPGLAVGSTLELVVMDNGPTNDMVHLQSLGFTPVTRADRQGQRAGQ